MQFRNDIKTERHVREFLEQIGAKLILAEHGKHWKITAEIGGRVIKTTLAITPSDHRTRKFEATRIKRMGRGVYEEAEWQTWPRAS